MTGWTAISRPATLLRKAVRSAAVIRFLALRHHQGVGQFDRPQRRSNRPSVPRDGLENGFGIGLGAPFSHVILIAARLP